MSLERDLADIDDALARCAAAHKALEAASRRLHEGESLYPVHVHLAAVEMAHAIEVSMKVAMRNQ